jgi:hypothetical protein
MCWHKSQKANYRNSTECKENRRNNQNTNVKLHFFITDSQVQILFVQVKLLLEFAKLKLNYTCTVKKTTHTHTHHWALRSRAGSRMLLHRSFAPRIFPLTLSHSFQGCRLATGCCGSEGIGGGGSTRFLTGFLRWALGLVFGFPYWQYLGLVNRLEGVLLP